MLRDFSKIVIVFLLFNIFSYKSESFSFEPKHPIVKYNGSVVFEIVGITNEHILGEVLLVFPSGHEVPIFKISEEKIVTPPSFWIQYFFLFNFQKMVLFGIDYRLDGVKLKAVILYKMKKIGEVISDPIKLDYQLESTYVTGKIRPDRIFPSKELYISGNKIDINYHFVNCLYGPEKCNVGFCCEYQSGCDLYNTTDIGYFWSPIFTAEVANIDVKIKRNIITMNGDLYKFIGCTFTISDNENGMIYSTKGISYGEVFRRTNSDHESIDYKYIGKHQINSYDIYLLSSLHKDPHLLCSCIFSYKSCTTIDQSIIRKCTNDNIKIKNIDRGILLFTISNTYHSREFDTVSIFSTFGIAGHIQI